MKTKLLILSIATLFLSVGVIWFSDGGLQSTPSNPVEAATPLWGTLEFEEQVKANRGEWVENAGIPIFDNQYLTTLPPRLTDSDSAAVLSSHTTADGAEKWIDVSLSEQKLRAYEGNRLVYEFPISSGRPGYDTVKGDFKVWRKVRNQAYRGGSRERGDYYYLPNVPYSLFFYQGYAIHGAYWHNDFGIKRRSSGCINLKITEAEQVYNWAGPAMSEGVNALNATGDNPGVRVVIYN